MNRILLLTAAAATVVLSAACAASGATPLSPPSPAAATTAVAGAAAPVVAAFPREVVSYPNQKVQIKAEPRRIAALSNDVAEVALELVSSDRLVAVPAFNENPFLSNQVEAAKRVANKIPSTSPDPEQVLAMAPDLVLITTRHGGEQDANALLARTGVPVVAFGSWATIDEVKENVRIIGRALGADARAEEVIARMEAQESLTRALVARATGPKPVVLALSNQSPLPFMVGPGSVTYDLLVRAGAMPAADVIGLQRTAPASIEQVIKADPDYIVLVDVLGRGAESYDTLMKNPAMQTVKAVRNNRIAVVPATTMFASSPMVVEGAHSLALWIHGGPPPGAR